MPRPSVPQVAAQAASYAPVFNPAWVMPAGVLLPSAAITNAPAGFNPSIGHIIRNGRAFQVLNAAKDDWDEAATVASMGAV